MIDPLTNVHEELAVVRRPFKACKKCMYNGIRREVADTYEGLVDICNLENMCRNAVHIAWMSLSEEEQQERIEQQKAETLPKPLDEDLVRCGECEYFEVIGESMTKCRKHKLYGVFAKHSYCSYGIHKAEETTAEGEKQAESEQSPIRPNNLPSE